MGQDATMSCHLCVFFSFSPSFIGRNSWRQQPGTFLIMMPLLSPLFWGEGSVLHGKKLPDNHVGPKIVFGAHSVAKYGFLSHFHVSLAKDDLL